MRATITFEAEIPEGVNLNDAEAWIEFELGANGQLRLSDIRSSTLLRGKQLEPVPHTLTIDFDEE